MAESSAPPSNPPQAESQLELQTAPTEPSPEESQAKSQGRNVTSKVKENRNSDQQEQRRNADRSDPYRNYMMTFFGIIPTDAGEDMETGELPRPQKGIVLEQYRGRTFI